MKFFSAFRRVIIILAYTAGISILLMMLVTVTDIVLRIFNNSLTGAYDIVRACGVIAIAGALPYVTAVKGHIAIEFFYHKCNRLWRIILDTVFRIISLTVFGFLAVHTFLHGISLYETGEVFPNLGLPLFWIPFVISFSCILMMIVFVYHLMHPGREFIKP